MLTVWQNYEVHLVTLHMCTTANSKITNMLASQGCTITLIVQEKSPVALWMEQTSPTDSKLYFYTTRLLVHKKET